jgi:hypothetical protein
MSHHSGKELGGQTGYNTPGERRKTLQTEQQRQEHKSENNNLNELVEMQP